MKKYDKDSRERFWLIFIVCSVIATAGWVIAGQAIPAFRDKQFQYDGFSVTSAWEYGLFLIVSIDVIAIIGLILAIIGNPKEERMRDIIAREKALDVMEKHGLRAFYFPAGIYIDDQELADACNILASTGHLLTDATGKMIREVAAARPSREEVSKNFKASFRLVKMTE